MNYSFADRVRGAIQILGCSQNYKTAVSRLASLADVDFGCVPQRSRDQLLLKIESAANDSYGPLLILSLPRNIQTEIALFAKNMIPGIDRTSYLKATPSQVVRKLADDLPGDDIADFLRTNYDFSGFAIENWEEYFSRCSVLFPAARSFLTRDEAEGGFSEDKLNGILLRNPPLVSSVPSRKVSPDTAVALLISGRVESLWETYDFTLLAKHHWRRLFEHTNPASLPEACRPFVENRCEDGFSDDELLELARKCHALINFLDPYNVPFDVAFELYQTGKADLLWKNYPFESLDKSEWRRILSNPNIRIPDFFADVARSGRFSVDELCKLAVRNERLLPFLVKINVCADKIINVLLACKATYIWENYRFNRFSGENWIRLIIGLKDDVVLKPRAMSALKTCKSLTEAQVGRILSMNPVYAPNVPIGLITPDVAVEMLMRGKSYFLWTEYDFKRLNDEQWLRLLGNTKSSIPPLGKAFLQYRAGAVDNAHLNAVLAKRRDLIEFVDAKYIAPDLAVSTLLAMPQHELMARFDFTRLDAAQLKCIIKASEYNRGKWPESLKACFRENGNPLASDDLIDLAELNPCIVADNVSAEWIISLDDEAFSKLVNVVAGSERGIQSLRQRLTQADGGWKGLPCNKLKCILAAVPSLRDCIDWKNWKFRDIAELAKLNLVFENEVKYPVCYFIWKHCKSLAAQIVITAAAVAAICLQNKLLAESESRRQHWNQIVQHTGELDRRMSYVELKSYLNGIPDEDASIVHNDVFVKIAREHVEEWEDECKIINADMAQLRKISGTGWSGDADSLIIRLEKCHVDQSDVAQEFCELKAAYDAFKKERMERDRIESLRHELDLIELRIPSCADIPVAEEWLRSVDGMSSEVELKERAGNVAAMLTKRIDVLKTGRAAELAQKAQEEIVAVSDSVAAVSIALAKPFAVENFTAISNEFNRIAEMPGFEEYSRLPVAADYKRLEESMTSFAALKFDAVNQLDGARHLDARYANEFMTVEGGEECSNIISRCETTIAQAKKRQWPSIIDVCINTKAVIEAMRARDLRCWDLVEKLNSTRDYSEYLAARRDLMEEFGHFVQLRHLRKLGNVPLEVLNRTYQVDGGSVRGGMKDYSYRFIGVIELMPEDPSQILISVDKSKLKLGTEIYTLKDTYRGGKMTVSSKSMFTVGSDGNFCKVDGVDFSNKQGAPLFVRAKHCLEKEQ